MPMVSAALARQLDAIARDARSALRLMTRAPAFTAGALLMIALGTGANAAMFSVIDAVLLRTPFDEPERIAIVAVVNEAMALRLAGLGDALESELAVRWPDGRTDNRQVVGILRNTRSSGSDTRARPEVYVPLAQNPSAYLNLILLGNAWDPRLPAAVRSAVAATDPSVALRAE